MKLFNERPLQQPVLLNMTRDMGRKEAKQECKVEYSFASNRTNQEWRETHTLRTNPNDGKQGHVGIDSQDKTTSRVD